MEWLGIGRDRWTSDEVAGWLPWRCGWRLLVMSAVSKYKLFLAKQLFSFEKQEISCWRKSAS